MGGVTDRAGPVRQSGRDQPVRARQRLGAGKLWRVGLGVGRFAPEQGRADRHRRLPVGHRVVDAPDDGPRAVLEGLDDVDRPQRPIAGQPFRHQPGDDLAQLRISDGAGDGHLTDVPANVEVRVVCPHRRVETVGSHHDPPPTARRERDATGDPVAEVRDAVAGPLGDHDLARVPDDRPGLEREDPGVLGREPLRHRVGSITTPNGGEAPRAGEHCRVMVEGRCRA